MNPDNNRVRTIDDFIQACTEFSEQQFCVRFPYAFLLHGQDSNDMVPIEQTRGLTLDRLVLDNDSVDEKKGEAHKLSYKVFELRPKTKIGDRITVGCSSSCDVQINDRSISAVHANLYKKGKTYIIQDNNSAAGTMIDDSLLGTKQSLELSSGNRIALGYIELIFLMPEEFYRFIRLFFGI